jgi:hypothetical protein
MLLLGCDQEAPPEIAGATGGASTEVGGQGMSSEEGGRGGASGGFGGDAGSGASTPSGEAGGIGEPIGREC